MPRVARHIVNKILDTEQMEVGQQDPRIMRSTGPASASLAPPRAIEVPKRPVDKEWLQMVAFSREMVTISINASPEKNAEDPVFCGNNGTGPMIDGIPTCWLFRNKEYTIERRFVESLCRAKITTFTQKDVVAPDGTRQKIMVPHTALRYPFRLIRDDHPRSQDWLKAIEQEPA